MTRQAHLPLILAAGHQWLPSVIRGEVLLVCIRLTFFSMQAQLRGVFNAAVAGGITFFDTAEVRLTRARTQLLADVFESRRAACWLCH